MLIDTPTYWRALAERLHASILDAERITWQSSDVHDWAAESHRLATMRAYVEPEGGWILNQDDIARNAPEVAEQLRKAGIQLAWTLQASLVQRAGQATGASGRSREMYDDECRELIQDVYAEDFARFGYSRDVL